MDNIWDENLLKSEVIGRCGGDEKNERPCRTNKSLNDKTLKKHTKKTQKTRISNEPNSTEQNMIFISIEA